MKTRDKLISVILATLLSAFIWGCGDDDDDDTTPSDQSLAVTIMHINDSHSHLEEDGGESFTIDGVKTYAAVGGFPRLAAKTEAVKSAARRRAQGNGNTLLLHAGDSIQGTPYFSVYNGEPEMAFMNQMGFDAIVVGNHEFDKGPGLLADYIEGARFPFLGANVDVSGDPDLAGLIAPYTVKDFNGVKVGIIGICTAKTANISSPGDFVTFADESETLAATVQELEDQGIHNIIALTHVGYEEDLELAAEVPGVDIIVGGHSHTYLGDFEEIGKSNQGDYPTRVTGPTGDPVYVVQAGEHAKALGMLDVEFDADGKVTFADGALVYLVKDDFRQKNDAGDKVAVDEATRQSILAAIESCPGAEAIAEDEAYLAMLTPYKEGVDALMQDVIATVASPIKHTRVPFTDKYNAGDNFPSGSYLAPLVAEGMLWKAESVGMDVVMAIQNAGGVRSSVFPEGDLAVGKIYENLPYDNTLVVLELTGARIKQALEGAVTAAVFGPDAETGPNTGSFPYVGGARYTADMNRPEDDRITALELRNSDGTYTAIDPAGVYQIATNAYIASGKDYYDIFGEVEGYRYDTGFLDNEVFMEYCVYLGTLTPPVETGVTFIPYHTLKIKIAETTDIHGMLFPYDFVDGDPSSPSLANVHSYVQTQRATGDQEFILLDNGDILQGQPIVYYSNFERDPTTQNHVVADVMNYMGYDAATVGNHDIEAGPAVYDRLVDQFNFPWLSANTIENATGQPYFIPYTIIERQGARIAVLGLTTPGIPNWLPENLWPGMEFTDMIESATYWMDYIQTNEDPDVVVGLFHAGYDYTYGNRTEDTPKNENASLLVARRVPGFDVIFIGHDHADWNIHDGTQILGGAAYAQSIPEATVYLTMDPDTGEYTDVKVAGEIVPAADYPESAAFLSAFDADIQEGIQYVGQEIGTFTASTTSRDAMFGDSSFNDLVHELQFSVGQTVLGQTVDVSFAAPLQFDKTIDAGPVYISDMFKLYKYENLLYIMDLTGAEIDGHLEYSYAGWTNQMTGPDDHLLNFTEYEEATGNYDLAARYYNYDSAAGIVYEVDVTQPAYDRVTILGMDADLDGVVDAGSPFDESAHYNVAINSYRGNGGGGHLTSENGANIPKDSLSDRILTATDRDLRYYLIDDIRTKGVVTPRAIGNWKFVPEDWAAAGAALDYPILYERGDGGH